MRRYLFPCMIFHVADNSVFALDIAIPCTNGTINIIVRKRAQQFMELWIGLVNHFPVQALAELRHIGIEPNQLQITGAENGTANGGIALNHSIFMVAVTAGVAVWTSSITAASTMGLYFSCSSRSVGRGCFGLPEYSGSVCAKLRYHSVDVLFRLMVDGGHGIFLTLPAALRDSGNGHIMLIPQLFHNLFQPVCRKAAQFHTATAGDSAGCKG